jgi:uncharacterized lipoprotein YddW (UPF0748 family)
MHAVRKVGRILCALLPIGPAVLVALAVLPSAAAQNPEFRSMWVTRFEWPLSDPNSCRSRINTIMNNLSNSRFNAVVFQVRGQADVLYPSPYEPWSPLLDENNPGWDPLAYAVNAAHTRNLEFHAYINTHTCWQSDPASAHTLPADLDHVLYQHCLASDPAHRDWLHHVDPNQPPDQFSESDYVWFAPGVPGFQAYVRQQVLYVVQHYAVDGVHFDRIRTPWSGEASWDPISRARFLDVRTNPASLDFDAWTADQVTRLVRDIYAQIATVRTTVKVSAAVYPNPDTAPTSQHQDALAWAQAGVLDMAIPMMYSSGGEGSAWDTTLQKWLTRTTGLNTHVVAGQSTSYGSANLIDQINLTRMRGAEGTNAYSWSTFTWWTTYRNGVYAQAAALPPMPWKAARPTAILCGVVRDPDGAPVVDAQVRLSGVAHVALSCADGFYSFVDVPPGTYTLTASRPGYADAIQTGVSLAAGQVRSLDAAFAGPPPPGDFNNDGHVTRADLPSFLFCLAGPGASFAEGHYCRPGDGDGDADVDLLDAAAFQQHFD